MYLILELFKGNLLHYIPILRSLTLKLFLVKYSINILVHQSERISIIEHTCIYIRGREGI